MTTQERRDELNRLQAIIEKLQNDTKDDTSLYGKNEMKLRDLSRQVRKFNELAGLKVY